MGKKTTPKKKPKKTTPKKKPASKFAMAGNGKANCGKLKPVATEKACRASARVMKIGMQDGPTASACPKQIPVLGSRLGTTRLLSLSASSPDFLYLWMCSSFIC